jgi:hypothetical protein
MAQTQLAQKCDRQLDRVVILIMKPLPDAETLRQRRA